MQSVMDNFIRTFSLSKPSAELFIQTAPNRYKFHSITKRHGGFREIAQPVKELKIVQRWAIHQYLQECNIHEAATAYIRGKGIFDHVQPHKLHKYLLKLDFKNFFNSINIIDFYQFSMKYIPRLTEEDIKILGLLFFCKNKNDDYYLSIGAPSSPHISNIMLYDFDCLIDSFCQDINVCYTRYADDLAFSTNQPHILGNVLTKVTSIISELDFPKKLELNSEKTTFLSKKHNRTLTGLVISNNGNISIGRDKKRELRAMVHYAKQGKLTPEKIKTLRGKIAFLKKIDRNFAIQLEQEINNLPSEISHE
jgi:RNA-directed DNA polymerase